MSQILLLILSSFFIVSSESYWVFWVSMEVYSFCLTPWLLHGESKVAKVKVFFYFLSQFLASIMMLVSSLTFTNKFSLTILFSSLLIKMSCYPFHAWLLDVLPYISWSKFIVLISLSKLTPLALMCSLGVPRGWMWLVALGLLLPIGAFETCTLQGVLAYSSVAHSSWLVICTFVSKSIGLLYIISYYSAVIPLCIQFMVNSKENMKELLAKLKSDESIQVFILLLVVSGIPPFFGFIPKFLVIEHLVQSGAYIEAVFLGVLSVLPVYMYLKSGLLMISMGHVLHYCYSNSWGVFLIWILCVIGIMAVFFML